MIYEVLGDEDDTPDGRQDLDPDEDGARMANMPECTAIQWRNIQQRQPSKIKAYGTTQFQTELRMKS